MPYATGSRPKLFSSPSKIRRSTGGSKRPFSRSTCRNASRAGIAQVNAIDLCGADAKRAADFKTVWDQFKATRDTEIIPAVYKGNANDARKIAGGIQLQRLSKMWGIMSCKVR